MVKVRMEHSKKIKESFKLRYRDGKCPCDEL